MALAAAAPEEVSVDLVAAALAAAVPVGAGKIFTTLLHYFTDAFA